MGRKWGVRALWERKEGIIFGLGHLFFGGREEEGFLLNRLLLLFEGDGRACVMECLPGA